MESSRRRHESLLIVFKQHIFFASGAKGLVFRRTLGGFLVHEISPCEELLVGGRGEIMLLSPLASLSLLSPAESLSVQSECLLGSRETLTSCPLALAQTIERVKRSVNLDF